MTDKALIRAAFQPRVDAEVQENDAAARLGFNVVDQLPHGTVVEGSVPGRIADLESFGMWVKLFEDSNVLRITGYDVDFDAQTITPPLPRGLSVGPTLAPVWLHHIVGLQVPVHPAIVAAIEATGAVALEPLSSFALLIQATPDQVDQIRNSLDPVRQIHQWIPPFHPAFRLSPTLRGRSGFLRNVAVVLTEPADAAALHALITGWGGQVVASHRIAQGGRGYAVITAAVDDSRVSNLLRFGTVRWIEYVRPRLGPEDERATQIVAAQIAAASGEPFPGYPDWLEAVKVDGSGSTVAICDTGVDEFHADLKTRRQEGIYYTPGFPTDNHGHGTHVAGIAVGRPIEDEDPDAVLRDEAGFLWGMGVAPGAEYVSQDALQGWWPPPIAVDGLDAWAVLTSDAVIHGADVMNNSWAEDPLTIGAGYTLAAARFDALIRRANPLDPESRPLTVVFSAGNQGPDEKTLTPPKDLKNAIVVGATYAGHSLHSVDQLLSESSRGPAADGRIAPTLVAPGVAIASARTQRCPLEPEATSVCWLEPLDGDAGRYVAETGTSMAAPHVSGACALLVERWRQVFGDEVRPTPAMLKALLINSAVDVAGTFDGRKDTVGHVPSPDQGWGRVNVATALRASPDQFSSGRVLVDTSRADLVLQPVFETAGATHLFSFVVVDANAPLRVTLAWTDAPGALGSGKALVNDLDLELVDDVTGAKWKGNVGFANGFNAPAVGTDYEHLNNVECIYLENPSATSTYSLLVHAHVLEDSALEPGDLAAPWQDYALVVENAVLDADPQDWTM